MMPIVGNVQARKKSTKINFLGPETARWGGVFHAKGWGSKTSCPPSKLCLPWVSKRGIWDIPGMLPGCPGPLGVFKKFVQKKFVLIFRSLNVLPYPEGPARHLDVSGQKLSPHCLETIFDSQLPSPKSSPKMPPKLSLPHRRGHFFLFQNYPCGEGNCEAIERQKLSRGNFCPGTSRCLAGPTGYLGIASGVRRTILARSRSLGWMLCLACTFGRIERRPLPFSIL